ncbi:MAG: hypothetical protein V7L06_16180 [Nostoc sp.]
MENPIRVHAQLIQGRDDPELPATVAFSDEQLQCFEAIAVQAMKVGAQDYHRLFLKS